MARRPGKIADATRVLANRGPRGNRPDSIRLDKIGNRRKELAEAALETLGELGYAKTSLRDIADNSEFTHGVLHYYFRDKLDLICCAMRHYKAICVTRYDEVMVDARTRNELIDGVVEKLAETLRDEAPMHRLWYDLRAEAMFEGAFRDEVIEIDEKLENMVWRIGSRLAELSGKPIGFSSVVLYGLLDGMFQRCLLRHLSGVFDAIPEFQNETRRVFATLAV